MNIKIDSIYENISEKIDVKYLNRISTWLLICSFFWIVSAASFSGFSGKWGFRENDTRNSIGKMLDATAEKPFVYRQLVPLVANFIDRVAPDQLKDRFKNIDPSETFSRMKSVSDPEIHFRYLIVYYFSFLSLFASLFILRKILISLNMGSVASILAPASFVIAFPYIQTMGGYFYDFTELMFFSLVFLLAIQGRLIFIVITTILATINKETFIFFLPGIYPILKNKFSFSSTVKILFLCISVAGIVNIYVKEHFIHSGGGFAAFHFVENLMSYVDYSTYLLRENTYGIVGPSGIFIGTIAIILIITLKAWRFCQTHIKQHIQIATAINLPLFIIFGWRGELRGLSIMYIGFIILIAIVIEQNIRTGYVHKNIS